LTILVRLGGLKKLITEAFGIIIHAHKGPEEFSVPHPVL